MATRARRDLAAMIAPLQRALIDAELPVLAAHGLSMWGYSVLSALAGRRAPTQSALARTIGADKTRIIEVLDELQRAGLIERHPDPADRRANVLALTAEGTRLRAAVQTAIQRNEERVLGHLSASDRAAFLRALTRLAELPHDTIAPPTDAAPPR